MKNSYRFYSNTECKYFPCHSVKQPENFNCLFCYCPLYLLDCKGNYVEVNGVKNCSNCLIPHNKDGYIYINKVLKEQVFDKNH